MPRASEQPFWARDWRLIADSKQAAWLDQKRRLGPGAGLRISDELRRQALAEHPEWPSPAQREADLQAHLRVLEILDRASKRRRR